MTKIKFCDYIQQIKDKEDLNNHCGQGYLFIRKDVQTLELVKKISGKKVFTIEIGLNGIMEEVEWDIADSNQIYPITIKDIVNKL